MSDELIFVKYAVISREPEENAIKHIKDWANSNGINHPQIIGWDFPHVSQEPINVYHMHGYAAACILPSNFKVECNNLEVSTQKEQQYAVITIKEPFIDPFTLPQCCILSEHGHFLLYYQGVFYDNIRGVFSEYDFSQLVAYLELDIGK